MLAAAFLLDHGADLSVASQYMNPPLSNAQMLLYDRLMKDITTHTIHDFTILVAKANALDIQDEISTVAHHMREFLNPDGLVLLVSTRQEITVARSATDEIDMGQLAHHFGGGHKRLASALIRSESRPALECRCYGKPTSMWWRYCRNRAPIPECKNVSTTFGLPGYDRGNCCRPDETLRF